VTEIPQPGRKHLLEEPVPSTLTITCPRLCQRVHDEQPGEVVIHESADVRIPQYPGSVPVLTQISQDDIDRTLRLHVGQYAFDPQYAEQLYAVLGALMPLLRDAEARRLIDEATR
jgi:hypothetical protein